MRNPGTLRISPERIYNGDYTQARNSTIQKMLRMIGFGDNIGSGFMKIIKAWDTLGFDCPEIHEEQEVNEVWLTLPLVPRRKSVEGTEKGTKDTEKGTKELNALIPAELLDTLTEDQRKILEYVWNNPEITLVELSEKMNTSVKSIRVQRKNLKTWESSWSMSGHRNRAHGKLE